MIEAKSNAVGIVSIVLTVLNGIVLIATVGTSLIVRQRFLGIFTDFDAELPGATVAFLSVPWVAWVAAGGVLLAVLVAKEFITRKWIPLWLNLLFVVAALGYWVVFVIAMVVPLISLVERLK